MNMNPGMSEGRPAQENPHDAKNPPALFILFICELPLSSQSALLMLHPNPIYFFELNIIEKRKIQRCNDNS